MLLQTPAGLQGKDCGQGYSQQVCSTCSLDAHGLGLQSTNMIMLVHTAGHILETYDRGTFQWQLTTCILV